ncbi:MAG: helix-turn-helix domain-containing protein [Planctomycetaceae bacterium]
MASKQSGADGQQFLTPKQLARAIGVSESSVKRWCDAGLIENSLTSGGHRRLLLDSVQEFLKANNHQVLDPGIFELNFSIGKSDQSLVRGRRDFVEALINGSETQLRQILRNYLAAGHSAAVVFDQILFPARTELRARIARHELEPHLDRFGTEICLRLVQELQSELELHDQAVPLALVAGLDGATDSLRLNAMEYLLCQQGWNAHSLGAMLPFQQLEVAIQTQKPLLLYLDVEEIRNQDAFLKALEHLEQVAEKLNVRLIVGVEEQLNDDLAAKSDRQYQSRFEKVLEESGPLLKLEA